MVTQVYIFPGLTKDQAQQMAQEAKDLAGGSKVIAEILLQPGSIGSPDLYSLRVTYPDPADPAGTPKPTPPPGPAQQPVPPLPPNGLVAPAEPPDDPTPLAAFAAAVSTTFWPVVDPGPNTRLVSYHPSPGKTTGNIGRCFCDDRPNRHHVGVDLFGEEGDLVVACADGTIANFYKFYNSKGRDTFALIAAHDGVVINYGEVARILFKSLA